MKSVIAQGSTVAKAIEEALKKAEMPAEFFVKLLEDAQSGFLGFGAKKAKIALFFKHPIVHRKGDNVLSQQSYENLFDNESMSKQIENQLKDVGLSLSKQSTQESKLNNFKSPQSRTQESRTQESRTQELKSVQQQRQRQRNQTQRTENHETQAVGHRDQTVQKQQSKPMQRHEGPDNSLQKSSQLKEPRLQQPVKSESARNQDIQKSTTQAAGDEKQSERPHRNHRRRRRSGFRKPNESQGSGMTADKMVVRPLLPKNNNDSSKS